MCDLQPKRPTSVQKLLFWGILGALSVLFAEVTVGSSPFAFFDAWGLLVVGLGMLVRPEALPALGPQASVWLLYAAAIAGLWLGLRRPRPASLFGLAESPDRFSWRLWFGLATVLVVTATGSRLLLGSGTWLFLIANLVVGVPAGVVILVLCFRDVLRPLRTGTPGTPTCRCCIRRKPGMLSRR